MRARPTRVIAVGTTATNLRDTPGSANDPNAFPVTFSTIRYPSGAGTIQLVPAAQSVYGDGQDVDADTDFNDVDQSLNRYAVASAGSINVTVTDYEA